MTIEASHPDMGRTTIQVSEELADELHGRKERGESYEDVIWRLVDAAAAGAQEPRVEPHTDTDARTDMADTQSGETDVQTDTADLEERMEATLADLDITGRGAETKEVRREAARYAWNELRDRGEATTQEIANAAFDEYADSRLGYSASENHYRGYTFWDSFARDVMKQLPGVESPPERGNTWRFDEDA